MKSTLLLFVLFAFSSFAQTFTSANEPAIGSLISLHLCDSNANTLAGTVGNNVTWDFSQIAGIFGVTKDIQILDASTDPNYASFAGATKVYDIGGTLSTFFSSSANDRISQGFVYSEAALGTVIAGWDIDGQKLMNYPFSVGNSVVDSFSGTVVTQTGPLPATGTSITAVDGSGTLMLPGNNTYNNVLRFHLKDSANASFLGNPIAFVRDVYEYYDFTVGNLPIFISTTISVISPLFTTNANLILSKDQPTTFVGINEQTQGKLTLYPNPATEEIFVQGINDGENFTILNNLGQVVQQGNYHQSIDVTKLQGGVYFVSFENNVISFIK
jgi:hypothetical protein